MKRLFLFILILFVSIGFVGCGKATISYTESDIVLYENQQYEIVTSNIKLSNKKKPYSITSLDENIAKIEENLIVPQSVGKTKIRLKINEKKGNSFDINFEVKKGKIAKTASVKNSLVTIDMSNVSITDVNKITTNSDCDEVPTITYDSTIIDYNYQSGVITAKKGGQTRVNIKYLFCQTHFDVVVKENIYVNSMKLNDCQVYENSQGKLDFQIFPLNANMYSFWSDSEDFVVYKDGTYESSTTNAVIKYQYYTKKNLKSNVYTVNVEVIKKLQDFDFVALDKNSLEKTQLLINNKYTLKIIVDRPITQENIILSNNLKTESELKYIENQGYFIDFSVQDLQSNSITIEYSNTLGGVENKVQKTKNYSVHQNNDLKVACKWLSTEILPDDNDVYQLYLYDFVKPNELYFMAKLGNEFVDCDIQVYQVLEDNSKVLVTRNFKPNSVGMYLFEVILDGNYTSQVRINVND